MEVYGYDEAIPEADLMSPELRAQKVGGYNSDVMLKLAPHTYATPLLPLPV